MSTLEEARQRARDKSREEGCVAYVCAKIRFSLKRPGPEYVVDENGWWVSDWYDSSVTETYIGGERHD